MIKIDKNCTEINNVKYEMADFIIFDLLKGILEDMNERCIPVSIGEVEDSLTEALEEIQEELFSEDMEVCC